MVLDFLDLPENERLHEMDLESAIIGRLSQFLHEHKQLFAEKYVTYLPSEQELQRELERERRIAEADLPRVDDEILRESHLSARPAKRRTARRLAKK